MAAVRNSGAISGKKEASAAATSSGGAVRTHSLALAYASKNNRYASVFWNPRAQQRLLKATGGVDDLDFLPRGPVVPHGVLQHGQRLCSVVRQQGSAFERLP